MIRQVTIPITEKVFSRQDISSLAELISKCYVERKKRADRVYHYQTFEVTLKAEDDAVFKLDKSELPDINALLRERKINQVTIRYSDPYTDDRSIDVQIEQVERTQSRYWQSRNSIDISSADGDWFNARRAELNEWLENVKNQSNLYIKYRGVLKHIFAFIMGYSFLYVAISLVVLAQHVGLIPPPSKQPTPEAIAIGQFLDRYSLIITLGVSYLYGRMWVSSLLDRLDKLWPSVELNFGSKYPSRASDARKVVGYLATVILIPVALAIMLKFLDL